ncbi:helix-turn-helix domain-containing protein [Alistipes finegoldii]|jgi:excisionase family DNA binding protein|uniref:helix-turn-helix domain-containing protein n=1 Tax=Alistipes finegoldii TaxID=214856 RepID=UPI00242BE8B1|nr:helix-turn-helix domain-containing protein [Alistipes finegoldii]
MDSQEVCQLLNITKRTLQSYRDKGVIAFSSVGGKFYYRQKDIDKYLRTRTQRKGVK